MSLWRRRSNELVPIADTRVPKRQPKDKQTSLALSRNESGMSLYWLWAHDSARREMTSAADTASRGEARKAEGVGRISKRDPIWERIERLHRHRFGDPPNKSA